MFCPKASSSFTRHSFNRCIAVKCSFQPASVPKPLPNCSLLGQMNKTTFLVAVLWADDSVPIFNLKSDAGKMLITFHGKEVGLEDCGEDV